MGESEKAMSHEERVELINKPFPEVHLVEGITHTHYSGPKLHGLVEWEEVEGRTTFINRKRKKVV